MQYFGIIFLLALATACEKTITVKLPAYEPQLAVEMYLEEGKPLRCLLTESLPYTDTAFNKPVSNAIVVVSDGLHNDTLVNALSQDTVLGRFYNYYHPRVITVSSTKKYTLRITDQHNRVITGATSFSQKVVPIDSVTVKPSLSDKDSFSVGMVISDPPDAENYYRFLVAEKRSKFLNNLTDFSLSDNSFNGQRFSFFSDPDYARNDLVLVRVYALQKAHHDYHQSTRDARRSNFNPFSQPALIKSNVEGGLGIFTAVRYDEREIVIR